MSQRLGDHLRLSPRGSAGQRVYASVTGSYISRLNSAPEIQTIGTLTVGGTIATETFTITSTFTDLGVTQTRAVTVTAATGDTAANVATKLANAFNADPFLFQVATASAAATVLTIAVRQEQVNVFSAIAATASGSATITASPTITPFTLTANIPFGYAVGQIGNGSAEGCRIFAGGLAFLGIALYDTLEQSYPQVARSTAERVPVDFYRSGDYVKIATNDVIWVNHLGLPAIGSAVYANDTTGQLQVAAAGGTLIAGARFLTNYTDGFNQVEIK